MLREKLKEVTRKIDGRISVMFLWMQFKEWENYFRWKYTRSPVKRRSSGLHGNRIVTANSMC